MFFGITGVVITLVLVWLAVRPKRPAPISVSYHEIRAMEYAVYGRVFHTLQGAYVEGIAADYETKIYEECWCWNGAYPRRLPNGEVEIIAPTGGPAHYPVPHLGDMIERRIAADKALRTSNKLPRYYA